MSRRVTLLKLLGLIVVSGAFVAAVMIIAFNPARGAHDAIAYHVSDGDRAVINGADCHQLQRMVNQAAPNADSDLSVDAFVHEAVQRGKRLKCDPAVAL